MTTQPTTPAERDAAYASRAAVLRDPTQWGPTQSIDERVAAAQARLAVTLTETAAAVEQGEPLDPTTAQALLAASTRLAAALAARA